MILVDLYNVHGEVGTGRVHDGDEEAAVGQLPAAMLAGEISDKGW